MNELRKSKLKQIISDEQQARAYNSNAHTTVIAGPGSGKTSILTLKALKLLENDIREPQGLGCITYSREAAREIRDRLHAFGFKSNGNSFFGTVHAFCIAEVLIPFAKLYKHFEISNPIRVASKTDRTKAYQLALRKFKYSTRDVSITEMNRERKIGILGISKIKIPSYDIALKVAKGYEEILHANKVIDFEDIVNYSTVLIQREAFVRKCLEAKFPWLLVDEYQDLGKPLHEIVLSLLLQTEIKIFAVGDPDQSIYGFQGAIPAYLEELATFTNIKKVILEKNYRSNQDIVNASEAVLEQNRGYVAGTRKEERAEFSFHVCDSEMIEQYQLVSDNLIPQLKSSGIPYDEIAILVGINSEVNCLAAMLSEKKIPFYISKHDFERTELIQWLENCSKWTLNNDLFSFDDLFIYWWDFLNQNQNNFNSNEISERVKLFKLLTDSIIYKENLQDWLKYILDGLSLINILNGSLLLPDELDNLILLQKTISENRINFDMKSFSELGRPRDQVTLATRHSSKGLEFEAIIMLGMEEERFPHYLSLHDADKLAESSRICFVCISRAKRICILVRSLIHTIPTRNGPWQKSFDKSRYWTLLENWQNEYGYSILEI